MKEKRQENEIRAYIKRTDKGWILYNLVNNHQVIPK